MKKRTLLALAVVAVSGCAESDPVSVTATPESAEVSASVTVTKSPDVEPVAPAGELTDGIYLVDHYDAKRDAKADLASAVEAATAMKRRILLEVGGNW